MYLRKRIQTYKMEDECEEYEEFEENEEEIMKTRKR